MQLLQRMPWAALVLLAAACVPWLGSRYYTFLATDIAILALFAASLNLLLGYTGLVSFGHAAYFGVGAYTCAILMKTYGVPFALAFAAAGASAAVCALGVRPLLRALDPHLFLHADARVRADRLGDLLQVELGDGRRAGPVQRALSQTGLDVRRSRLWAHCAAAITIICWSCLLVGFAFWLLRRIVDSPFGSVLTAVRENPERAEFVGVNVRRYQLAAFVVAGAFAGWAGALFGIFNRGVFPDFAHWSKSAEVLIMVILGGIGNFWGPAVGAAMLILLNQQINAYTQYWPLILGSILIVLVFVFPSGVFGTLRAGLLRDAEGRDA